MEIDGICIPGGTLGISGWGCAAGTLEPLTYTRANSAKFCYPQGGLATAFDLAAFRLSMIAPVKKSVNHSRTIASIHVRNGLGTASRSSSSQRVDRVK